MGKFEPIMNSTNIDQSKIYMYGLADNFVLFLNGKVFTKVYIALRSITMYGFMKDLKALCMIIRSGVDNVDPPNGIIIIKFNKDPLI